MRYFVPTAFALDCLHVVTRYPKHTYRIASVENLPLSPRE